MKQRLVGTLVLGSLALIFIPILLDGEGVKPAPLSITAPLAPIINTEPLPEPVRPEILSDSSSPFDVLDEATTEPAVETSTASTDITDAALSADATVSEPAAEVATTAVEDTPLSAAEQSEPQLDSQGLPDAWSVRLGIFADKANAEKLVSTLQAAGNKAYLRPFQSAQGSLNAVYVGPVITRSEATTLQQQLAAAYKLNGIVQKFEIGAAQ